MRQLIISEMERVWSRSKTKTLLITFILLSTLWSIAMGSWNVGFYDSNITMPLNSLNFSVFILRDIHPLLMFVILPMLYTDCFNAEYTSGSYRNVMTRPYKKTEFILAKLIAQAFITFVFLMILFIISSLFSKFFLDTVETTKFFNITKNFNSIEAFIYSFKFYVIEFLILFDILSISSLICGIIENSVLSFLAIIAVFLGSLYISDSFVFFLSSSKMIFDVLADSAPMSFFTILFFTTIIGISGTIALWKHKDWLF
ncbi:MAG TPA: hypothetical protein DCL31_00795 [Clostridium sp.]|nr:hypothetical protein [Clostridium sp.]